MTDLRSLRATLEALPANRPISGLLRRSEDFRRQKAMADALLHPQDRAYTVPEMYDWLDRCGISFGRWIEQAPYLAQCGVLANSPHRARQYSERSIIAALLETVMAYLIPPPRYG